MKQNSPLIKCCLSKSWLKAWWYLIFGWSLMLVLDLGVFTNDLISVCSGVE